jgi:hypothetical protein
VPLWRRRGWTRRLPASPEADGDVARAGSAEEEAEELGAGGGGELGLESKIVAIPDQVPKEAIFTASLREFATNAQFFHANCARLWCLVTARGRTGELVAEPGRYGRHLQGRSKIFHILFHYFGYMAYTRIW